MYLEIYDIETNIQLHPTQTITNQISKRSTNSETHDDVLLIALTTTITAPTKHFLTRAWWNKDNIRPLSVSRGFHPC